jgi:acetyl esterase/lipase
MVASQDAPAGAATRFFSPRRSLWQRIFLTIKVRFFKAIVTSFIKVSSLPGLRNKAIQPTYTKVYACQPTLINRIFIPKSYKSGDVLPLYISIHGGGFVIGSPAMDDPFSSGFANDNKIILVSMDYPKAPESPYPAAVNALIETVKAVLADESLPFDKSKIAIGGFSAGGNLSLAVAQDETLRNRIGGVTAYYPAMDFVSKGPEKMLTRPEGAPPDMLENAVAMFDYSYVPVGQDLRDPRLSVTFATRESLPSKICIIGCEFDLLCKEAELFAEKVAVGGGERTGSEIIWEQNGVRWEKVLGEEHGTSIE